MQAKQQCITRLGHYVVPIGYFLRMSTKPAIKENKRKIGALTNALSFAAQTYP